jgi:hypothetical protein
MESGGMILVALVQVYSSLIAHAEDNGGGSCRPILITAMVLLLAEP